MLRELSKFDSSYHKYAGRVTERQREIGRKILLFMRLLIEKGIFTQEESLDIAKVADQEKEKGRA